MISGTEEHGAVTMNECLSWDAGSRAIAGEQKVIPDNAEIALHHVLSFIDLE